MLEADTASLSAADPRPVLIYDGHCRFCVQHVSWLERLVNGAVRLQSYHDPGVFMRYPGLTPSQCERALQFVESDGRIYGGAEAIAATLLLRPALAVVGWLYYVPGIRQVADWSYHLVARNRFDWPDDVCLHDACRQHRL